MSTTTPVLVDCDTGVDDAIALVYLLAHPEVEVVGGYFGVRQQHGTHVRPQYVAGV